MERFEINLPVQREKFMEEFNFFGCEDGENVVICCHKCRKPRRVNLTQCDKSYNDGLIDKKYLPEPINSYFELEKIEGVYYPQKNLQHFTCDLYMKILPRYGFLSDMNPCEYYADKIDDAFVCDLKYPYGIITSGEKFKQRGINYKWLRENFNSNSKVQNLLKTHITKNIAEQKKTQEAEDLRSEQEDERRRAEMAAEIRAEMEREWREREKRVEREKQESKKRARAEKRQEMKSAYVEESINLDSDDDTEGFVQHRTIPKRVFSPKVKVEFVTGDNDMAVDQSLEDMKSIPVDDEPQSNFASPDDGSVEKMDDRESLNGVDISDDETQQEEKFGFDFGKPSAIYKSFLKNSHSYIPKFSFFFS